MMLLLGGICGGYAAAIIGIEACYGEKNEL
jgi:hypothetical protein